MERNIHFIDKIKDIVNNHNNKKENRNVSITSKKNNIQEYNIKKDYCLTKNDIDILKKINNFFINFFSIDLSIYLNIHNIHIKSSILNIGTDFNNISPVNKSVILNKIEIISLKDSFFIIFSSDFLSMIIENLFGGNKLRINTNNFNKKITSSECKIMKHIAKIIVKGYEKSIKNFFPIKMKYIKYKIISDEDKILYFKKNKFVITTFQIKIATFQGFFSIIIPFFKIKKYLFNTEVTEESECHKNKEKEHILKNIYNLNLNLTVKLTESLIPLSDLLKLKSGDILSIQQPEDGIVYIDCLPIFLGKHTIVNGKHALCVKTLIKSGLKL